VTYDDINKLTLENVRQECDRQHENTHENIGDCEICDEVVGDGAHLSVAIDNRHDEAVVDDPKKEDDEVGNRQNDDHRRRLAKQRPWPHGRHAHSDGATVTSGRGVIRHKDAGSGEQSDVDVGRQRGRSAVVKVHVHRLLNPIDHVRFAWPRSGCRDDVVGAIVAAAAAFAGWRRLSAVVRCRCRGEVDDEVWQWQQPLRHCCGSELADTQQNHGHCWRSKWHRRH